MKADAAYLCAARSKWRSGVVYVGMRAHMRGPGPPTVSTLHHKLSTPNDHRSVVHGEPADPVRPPKSNTRPFVLTEVVWPLTRGACVAMLVDQEGTVNPDVTRRSDEKKKYRHGGEGAAHISVQQAPQAPKERSARHKFDLVS